jgi:hypothetical protein
MVSAVVSSKTPAKPQFVLQTRPERLWRSVPERAKRHQLSTEAKIAPSDHRINLRMKYPG